MPKVRIRPRAGVLGPGKEAPVAPGMRPTLLGARMWDLRRCFALTVLAFWVLLAAPASAQDQPPVPQQSRIEAVVRILASREMAGRRGEGARKAAGYLVDEFQRLRLEPLFGGAFVQEIPGETPGRPQGRNVGGILRGSDPAVRDQYVIVSAHFDHLGSRGEVIYPGADDNASGVAMMLEVARSMTTGPSPPRRSVAFIGFDLEEVGLFGSRYFVAHSPIPLDRIALFITADMIGGALAGVCDPHVFVLGSEHAPGLRPWLERAARDEPLTIGLLGSDLLVLNRSDYGPFRNRRVPYLFFSTGESPTYHSPDDGAESLNYPKLTAISRVIHRVTRIAADEPEVPRWCDAPDHPLAEAVTIRDVIRLLIANRETLRLGGGQLFLMNRTAGTLEQIIARGAITADERTLVIQAARLVLLLLR